jgi:hypothetical protein
MVFQVLDKDELKFPFREPSVFQDMEEDLKLLTDPHAIRAAYLDAIHGLIKHYRESCAAYLIDYSLFDTSVGLDRAGEISELRGETQASDTECLMNRPLNFVSVGSSGGIPILIHRLTQRRPSA